MTVTGIITEEDTQAIRYYLKKYPVIIDTLPPREAVVLEKMLKGENIEDIAKSYCVTRERIRQVYGKAVGRVLTMYGRLLLEEEEKTK